MRKLRWVMAVMAVTLSVGRAGWGAEGGVPIMGLEAPSIDKVVAVEPISLKTKGKTPEEAFVMLGDAVGIDCGPRMVGGVLNRGAWRNRVFDNVDFDLEKVSFWQGALRLEDHAKVMPTGQGRWMSVLNMPSIPKPEQVTDTGPLRVQLFVDKAAAVDKNGRLGKQVTVEFLLDPRLTFMDLGKMEVDGADDAGGKRLETEAKNIQYPGAVPAGMRAVQHGDRAATGEVQIRWGAGEKTPALEVFRGRVPAVVATKVERVEFVVQDGVAMDMKAHRVGDWSVQVTRSTIPGGFTGNLRIDHEIELELERMTETAPPFPRLTFVRFEEGASGELGDLVGKTTADGKKRTVAVKLRGEEKVPGKIVVDVPLEAKAVVLPFEFRKVRLGEGGGK